MIAPKSSQSLISELFAEISTKQFVQNLQKHCPEVFSKLDQHQNLSETKVLSKKAIIK